MNKAKNVERMTAYVKKVNAMVEKKSRIRNKEWRGSVSCLFYISDYLYIEYFLRNRPKYSIRFAICIVKKYDTIEQTGRKCKKYSMKL